MAESVKTNNQPEKPKRFKERYTFEERLAESKKRKEQNPKLIPIIVEKHPKAKLPELEKSKYLSTLPLSFSRFLVSGDLKLYEFLLNIKQKLKLNKNESLFFFIADKKIDKQSK